MQSILRIISLILLAIAGYKYFIYKAQSAVYTLFIHTFYLVSVLSESFGTDALSELRLEHPLLLVL